MYGEISEFSDDIDLQNVMYINDSLWLRCDNEYSSYPNLLGDREQNIIKKVVLLFTDHIKQCTNYNNTIIHVKGLQYNYNDYQEEGLVVACAQWLAKAFNFEIPDISVKR